MPVGGGSGEGGLAARGYNGPAQPGGNASSGVGGAGGNNTGGSNVNSSGSAIGPPGTTYSFGWQPDFPGQWAPEEKLAAFDPNMANYNVGTFRGGQPLSGGVVGLGGGNNPQGAGGSNSGQGGMGAGRRAGLVRALGGGGISRMGWR
jgi:hypothetical protein